jgi:putative FmdB family regulatory protein
MPIYEYRCGQCQHKLEALQKFSDAPLVDCPACGAPALSKLVSAAGFQLKGSGWYQTDFRGNGKKQPDKPDAAPATAEAKPDSATAEPAAKSETAKSDTGKSETPAAAPAGPKPASSSSAT